MTDIERVDNIPSRGDSLAPDHIWAIVGPTVEASFKSGLSELIASHAVKSGQEPDMAVAEALQSEVEFTKLVSASVFEATELNPTATEYDVLFDLDETAVVAPVDYDPLHLVRPSMIPLMAALKGVDPRINFGVLTTRSQEYLDGELANPAQLAEMIPYLDPSLVLSSRNTSIDTLRATHYTNEQAGIWYNEVIARKVAVCEGLLAIDPARSVVLVDDLPQLNKANVDTHFRVAALDNSPARFSVLQ